MKSTTTPSTTNTIYPLSNHPPLDVESPTPLLCTWALCGAHLQTGRLTLTCRDGGHVSTPGRRWRRWCWWCRWWCWWFWLQEEVLLGWWQRWWPQEKAGGEEKVLGGLVTGALEEGERKGRPGEGSAGGTGGDWGGPTIRNYYWSVGVSNAMVKFLTKAIRRMPGQEVSGGGGVSSWWLFLQGLRLVSSPPGFLPTCTLGVFS